MEYIITNIITGRQTHSWKP